MKKSNNDRIKGFANSFNTCKILIIIGALLLIAGAFLGWIDRPLTGWLRGDKIRLSENLSALLSYGFLSLVLGLLSLAALHDRFRWIGGLIGAICLVVSLNFFLTYSVFDSKEIMALSDLNEQAKQILSFNKHLPPNYGKEPTFNPSITVDTLRDRIYATLHFASIGWYTFILGGLSLLAAFIKSARAKKTKTIYSLSFIIFILLYLSMSLYPYITAEYHRNKGDGFMSLGMYSEAIDEYKIAKKLDLNMDYSRSFHINRGRALYLSGRDDTADFYIYRADLFMQEKNYPMALFYLKRALIVEPSATGNAGNKLLSRAYVKYGLSLYKKGMASTSVELWRKSLDVDSSRIQSYYFLSRAYYEINSFEKSINAGISFFNLSGNKIMKANVSSNIADSFYKLKKFASAREFYIKSIILDKDKNVRAIMSLIGG